MTDKQLSIGVDLQVKIKALSDLYDYIANGVWNVFEGDAYVRALLDVLSKRIDELSNEYKKL